MTEARRLIEAGEAQHAQLIMADEQTQGRGRQGRKWNSNKGNFTGTFIFDLDVPPFKAAELSFVTAVVVGECIKSFVPNNVDVCYKWPNDVLVDQCKIAGVLLEAHDPNQLGHTWLSIGIGLNIQSFPEDTTIQATCLNAFAKEKLTLTQVQQRLCDRFQRYFQIWATEGFEPIRQIWLEDAASRSKQLSVLSGNETVTGKFVDLDQHGRLVLELESKETKQILAGDVFFPELRMNN